MAKMNECLCAKNIKHAFGFYIRSSVHQYSQNSERVSDDEIILLLPKRAAIQSSCMIQKYYIEYNSRFDHQIMKSSS